ncbi:MAG: hypothetical protein Q7T82_04760 [Armatimonadota bacterium]|nr:hypothetical protein [Armatimonadota bacterium]
MGVQGGVIGGSGVNNIGLLVRVWGRVAEQESVTPPQTPTWFRVDDGSHYTVKVILPAGVAVPGLGACVQVTGNNSCEKLGEELHRLLRLRSQEDIKPLLAAP